MSAVCLAYLLVRLWHLTDSCLWFDEIFSVHAAEHPWSEILWFVAQDLIHPPLFYLLLKIWIAIGGESLFWLRSLPVVFSILALWPFYLLCRELKLKFPSIVTALILFAINGALIKYSQELRGYSLLLFFSLVSIWLFSRFYFRGKNIWILTIVNALMIYTHYFGWFVMAGEVLTIFIFQRIKIRHVLIMLAIEFVAFVPWVWAIWKAAGTGASVTQNIGWIERPGIGSIFEFAFDVVEPFYFQQSSSEPSSHLYITIPLIAIVAAAKVVYLANWKKHTDKNAFWLLSILAVLPLVLAFVLSWILPVSIWGSRHLIVVFPPMIILIAMFVWEVSPNILRNTLLAAMGAISVVSFAVCLREPKPNYIWCAWGKAAEILPPGAKTIYTFEDLAAYHLWSALRNNLEIRVVVVKGSSAADDPAYFLPRGFEDVRTIDVDNLPSGRVWLAFRDVDWNEQHEPLASLIRLGFKIGSPTKIDADGQTAFIFEAIR
jgi:mannosyltransferase